MKSFLFSFIIPCWNVEEYISEALESVLAQSLDFKENIQIVLVNNDSTDGTNAICEDYRKRYPHNIILLAPPLKSGVSAARNMGLAAATGRYINFLDADDKWDTGACLAALDFFKEYPHAHIVCFPIKLFGTDKGEHWLNEKFKETRLANIFEDPDCAVLNACACFCEREAVKNCFFDEQMQIAEDRLWLGKLMLDEQNFGLIVGPAYHYRKHPAQLSSLETTSCCLSYYLDTPRQCYLEILRYAQEKYGEVPLWAQYAVIGDLTLRLREKSNTDISPLQKEEYRKLMQACLARIGDPVILSTPNLWSADRLYALALKYNVTYEQVKEWVQADAKRKLLCFSRPGDSPMPFSRLWVLRVESLEISRGYLFLRGCCAVLMPRELVHLVLIAHLPDGGVQEYPCELLRHADLKEQLFFEEELWVYEGFELSIPLADLVDGTTIRAVEIINGETFALNWLHKGSSPFLQGEERYRTPNGSIITTLADKQGIRVETIDYEDSLRFQFSFVVPAWNEEKYLAESVESVLGQTAGFEDNIQLVLVNDGSDDGTAAICRDYCERYPDNIVYVEQPHRGVNDARNAGLAATSGKYIGFLDADDRLDADICKAAQNFFNNHPWVHVVCSPIMLFSENEEEHPFNEQFGTTIEVAHIFEDPQRTVFGPCSCFFDYWAIQGRLFGETLPISKDAVWMAKLLLDIQDFGQLSGPYYHKRERPDRYKNQETDSHRQFWYLELPRLRHLEIFRHAREKYGSIPQWVQFAVLSDVASRIQEEDDGFLSSAQKEEYRSLVQACLTEMDDEILVADSKLNVADRICALAVKYGISCNQVKTWVETDKWAAILNLHRPENQLLRFCDVPPLQVDFLDITNGQLQLRGSFAPPVPRECIKLVLEIEFPNGDRRSYPCELIGILSPKTRLLVGEDPDVFRRFNLSVPLAELAQGVMVRAIASINEKTFTLAWSYKDDSLFNQGDGKKHQTQKGAVIVRLPNNKGICIESFSGFLFSFVIPAYNVKPYLAEAIESVITQTIGFKDNIQIVLVNDGSTDGTGAICKRYRDLYPNNIVYIDKPNGGVSSARNAGMRAATGKYINFLDGDDKWDEGACKAALEFFEKNPKINIVCFPIRLFGRSTGIHYLNYKFKQTKVASIFKDTDYTLNSAATCFIKAEVAKRYPFNETLAFGEDQSYCSTLLIDEQNFGIISRPSYQYRRGFEQTSASDTEKNELHRYLLTPSSCHLNTLHYAEQRHGTLLPWAQYAVMINLTFRIKEQDYGFLTPVQKEEYRALLRACLTRIDDQIICTVRNFVAEERLCALALKYDTSYEQVKEWVKLDEKAKALSFCRPGAKPQNFIKLDRFWMEFMDMREGQLILRGSCITLVPHERMVFAMVVEDPDGNVHEYPCELYRRPDKRKSFFFEDGVWALESFKISLPLAPGLKVRAVLTIDGASLELRWVHRLLSPFAEGNMASYLARAGYIVSELADNRGLYLESLTNDRIQERERAFLDEILREPNHPSATWIARLRQAGQRLQPEQTGERKGKTSKRRVWLYHDCHGVEKNNAYYQFLHDIQINDGVRRYYVVNDELSSKQHLFTPQQMKRVIPFNSIRHQLLFFAAEQIITAYIEPMNWNPFEPNTKKYYADLFHARIVYLQHGVLHAHTPTKYSFGCLPIDKEVISTHFEQRNMSENYGFDAEHLIPAGMPRYDFMDCDAEPHRKILFAPSWRRYLAFPKEEGQWYGIPSVFTKSPFYLELNAFLQHKDLIDVLERNDYTLELKLHPILAELYKDYFHFDHPRIQMAPDSVHEEEYSVFITDFSSYRFDFVYLKRAILYFFPDEDMFKAGKCSYRETDLPIEGMFGDMARTADEAVELLTHIIANGGKPEEKYAKQMDGFFLHYDNKQRERLYQELVKVNEK